MENTISKQDLYSETYNKIERMIDSIVWKFQIKYGLPFDELKSEANYQFMIAYNSYNDSKNLKLTSWLYRQICHQLLNFVKESFKEQIKTSIDEITYPLLNKSIGNFTTPIELLDSCGEDAKTIIRLIWNPPIQLLLPDFKGKSLCHTKNEIREYLRSIGWKDARIKKSEKEICEVIHA